MAANMCTTILGKKLPHSILTYLDYRNYFVCLIVCRHVTLVSLSVCACVCLTVGDDIKKNFLLTYLFMGNSCFEILSMTPFEICGFSPGAIIGPNI